VRILRPVFLPQIGREGLKCDPTLRPRGPYPLLAISGVASHLAGNLLHDAHTAILMREHGIGRICTRDTDSNQFPFLEVIDPLKQ